jgi:hypothetical protein
VVRSELVGAVIEKIYIVLAVFVLLETVHTIVMPVFVLLLPSAVLK